MAFVGCSSTQCEEASLYNVALFAKNTEEVAKERLLETLWGFI